MAASNYDYANEISWLRHFGSDYESFKNYLTVDLRSILTENYGKVLKLASGERDENGHQYYIEKIFDLAFPNNFLKSYLNSGVYGPGGDDYFRIGPASTGQSRNKKRELIVESVESDANIELLRDAFFLKYSAMLKLPIELNWAGRPLREPAMLKKALHQAFDDVILKSSTAPPGASYSSPSSVAASSVAASSVAAPYPVYGPLAAASRLAASGAATASSSSGNTSARYPIPSGAGGPGPASSPTAERSPEDVKVAYDYLIKDTFRDGTPITNNITKLIRILLANPIGGKPFEAKLKEELFGKSDQAKHNYAMLNESKNPEADIRQFLNYVYKMPDPPSAGGRRHKKTHKKRRHTKRKTHHRKRR